MDNSASKNPAQPSGPTVGGKPPYTKPVLRVFGSVKHLTKGGSGSNIDNNGGNRSFPPPKYP